MADMDEMISNQEFIKKNITTNDGEPVPYRWTHGATDEHLGDGILVYSLIQHMRSKNCVCIGSGGGYIPRIITQARIDLYKQGIFEGNGDYNWGNIGATYVVDACNGVGGPNDLDNEDSFHRKNFYPRFIKSTSVDAYYDFFIRQDIKIDLLWIDGDHSYESTKLAVEYFASTFADECILVFDDANWDGVIDGALAGIESAGLTVQYDKKILNNIEDKNMWWNGVFIALVNKHKASYNDLAPAIKN